jgi:putative membrane-bound dehydrogenase-like protein
MRFYLLSASLCVLCGLFSRPCVADDFPTPFNAGAGSDSSPLDPQKAAEGFQLPPGFKCNVFAAEPDVQNPVAMTWDNRGRLWVAECYTYANRPTRYDLTLRDRVIILNDTDGDGRADERKVFTDDVQQLMSVEVGLGGVWLIALPRLLFIPDKNGDDIPDGEPEVILDGFETSTENYHNCANGLRWGPDGWLYGRCGASSPGWIGPPGSTQDERVPIYGGIWRYHPTRKIFEVLCHGFTNPWGLDWDEYGEAFITNTVTGHLFHLIPGAHHTRSATVTPNRRVYDTIDSHADHFHYDNGRGWRATEGDATRDKLGGGHAHCGACIYLGDNWPAEYRGKLLTLNLHGRRINVDRLEREGSGYVARHEPDIAQSADTWFRGVDLNYGPDGAVYFIDWSDTGECHEHDGVHRLSGRVFRITDGFTSQAEQQTERPKTDESEESLNKTLKWYKLKLKPAESPISQRDVTKFSKRQLFQAHAAENQWIVRHARQELIDRQPTTDYLRPVIGELETIIKDVAPTARKLNAVSTLRSLNALSNQATIALTDERDEHFRAWGIRLLTDFWPIDTVYGQPRSTTGKIDRSLLPRFIEMAKADESGLVRLVLASTLQRIPPADRPQLAAALLSRAQDANDHNLPKLIWYGLASLVDTDPQSLVPLAAEGKLPLTREWITRALAEEPAKNAAAIDKLFLASLSKDESVRADIVRGLTAGLAGRRKVAPPPSWEKFQASFQAAAGEVQEQVRNLAVVFGDGRALDEVRRVALDDKAKVPQRQTALETLIEARPDDLRDICQRLLRVRFLNTTAMKGLTLFDDPELAQQLARNYNSFHPSERPAVIETLVARPTFAAALLDQIDAGRIPPTALGAGQARQIRSFSDASLSKRLADVWGELRDSPEEKRSLVDLLKHQLTKDALTSANMRDGRAVFKSTCANCHRLFGDGGTVAPDLTGSGRQNLDYLLENIIDPSAVVNKDFRMSVLRMADGRVLNGLIMSQDDERVVLQTAKEKLTLMRSEIDEIKLTTLSPMPEGILQPLTPDQIRDLIAYLRSPTQIDLPQDDAGSK